MTKQQTATLHYLRIAPRKVRAIAGILNNLSVNEAEAQLLLTPRRPAGALLKLLRSGVANAKQKKEFNIEKLYVASIRVDGGPMLHRYLPRARGHADPIQKKSSHVTIVLQERDQNRNPFLIQEKKKKKRASEDRPRKRRMPKPAAEEKAPEKQGFFKRIFSRRKAV